MTVAEHEMPGLEGHEAPKPLAVLKVSESPGAQWGPDSASPKQQKAIKVLAKNVLALALAVARREYPEWELHGEVTQDFGVDPIYGTPMEVVSYVATLVHPHIFTAEALWDPKFDPEEYLPQVK